MRGLKTLLACRQVKRLLKENGPLVGLIVAGTGFTCAIISTARATIKAVRNTDYQEKVLERELTGTEVVEANWQYYVAPALLWAGGITSLCLSARGYDKSIKSLAALYAASETARKNFEDATKEKLGERKYDEIREEAAQKTLDTHPVADSAVIDTGHGSFLCYDTLSGRYFRCCADHIKRAVNYFNNEICTRKCGLSYNDLFEEISSEFDSIILGEDVGWGPHKGIADIYYTTKLASNGEPCLVMEYNVLPYRHYDWCG